MNRIRIAITVVAVALLATACTQRGYHADPVVSANDPRSTDTPELGDAEGRAAQQCFKIEIYANGWDNDYQDEGIACMVTTTTVPG